MHRVSPTGCNSSSMVCWRVVNLPVQKLSSCHELSDKVHLARCDVDGIQADTVWMLHLHQAVTLQQKNALCFLLALAKIWTYTLICMCNSACWLTSVSHKCKACRPRLIAAKAQGSKAARQFATERTELPLLHINITLHKT